MPKAPVINNLRRARALHLRQNETQAEIKLWHALKRLNLKGSHFRRQMPIGTYIIDFACPAARIIIEVDGSQHSGGPTLSHDLKRTAWLSAEGYRVLRFWNNDVLQNPDAVLDAIYAELYGALAAESRTLKHKRRSRRVAAHPTPAR